MKHEIRVGLRTGFSLFHGRRSQNRYHQNLVSFSSNPPIKERPKQPTGALFVTLGPFPSHHLHLSGFCRSQDARHGEATCWRLGGNDISDKEGSCLSFTNLRCSCAQKKMQHLCVCVFFSKNIPKDVAGLDKSFFEMKRVVARNGPTAQPTAGWGSGFLYQLPLPLRENLAWPARKGWVWGAPGRHFRTSH